MQLSMGKYYILIPFLLLALVVLVVLYTRRRKAFRSETGMLRGIENYGQSSFFWSSHDKLTGLYNRLHFLKEARLYDKKKYYPLSFLIFDINGLNYINEMQSFAEGDNFLVELAETFKSNLREEGLLARWGGDEFAILLPNKTKKEAQEIGQNIVNSCRKLSNKYRRTISFGLATKKEQEEDLQEVMYGAERQLEKSKLMEKSSTRSTIIKVLYKAMEEKGDQTEEHLERVQNLACDLGSKLSLSESDCEDLILLVALHDIGKLLIPNDVILKPDKLTVEEWDMIKEHPETGYRIAMAIENFSQVADGILSHHEWWDGSGYPRGLRGTEIPLIARIASIIDAYDVMINGRPYKKPMAHREAILEINRCRGTQFEPYLVDILTDMLDNRVGA